MKKTRTSPQKELTTKDTLKKPGFIIGADPGQKGGVVVLNRKGEIVVKTAMPLIKDGLREKEIDVLGLRAFISPFVLHDPPVFLERVHSMPKQGVKSMFTFGQNYGSLIALFETTGLQITLVTPKEWQGRVTDVPGSSLLPKERALVAAARIFPKEKFLATSRSKVPHDGMIDAGLIAEYGRRVTCLA